MTQVPHRLLYALSTCAVAGIRITPARRRLLEALASAAVPTLVEELVRGMAKATGAHAVTFYRFLGRLEARGIVHRISLRQRAAVMLSCEETDYLVCIKCGSMTQLATPAELKSWQTALATRTGFLMGRHWYELAGICPDCQAHSR